MKTYHQGIHLPFDDSNLDLVRSEIKKFIQNEKSTPIAKFIERISNVYEDHISYQNREFVIMTNSNGMNISLF